MRGATWPTTTQRLLKATSRPRWRGGASSAMYTGTTLEARPTAMPTIMRPATWQGWLASAEGSELGLRSGVRLEERAWLRLRPRLGLRRRLRPGDPNGHALRHQHEETRRRRHEERAHGEDQAGRDQHGLAAALLARAAAAKAADDTARDGARDDRLLLEVVQRRVASQPALVARRTDEQQRAGHDARVVAK